MSMRQLQRSARKPMNCGFEARNQKHSVDVCHRGRCSVWNENGGISKTMSKSSKSHSAGNGGRSLHNSRGLTMRMRRMCLRCLEQTSNQFHSLPINPHVGMPNARGRAKMNPARLHFDAEFHIVRETKEYTSELDIQIVRRFLDNPSFRELPDDFFQRVNDGLRTGVECNRRDPVFTVLRLSGNTIGRIRTRCQLPIANAKIAWPPGGDAEDKKPSRSHGQD